VVNGVSRHIFAYLGDFLFEPERARTPVKALSGGERNRLLLARHFLNPGNLLAMDEPTNDLDIETLDLLEEQLSLFDGTVLLVSHDRAFLDNVVTSTLVFEGDGVLHAYPGGFSDWRAAHDARIQAARAVVSDTDRVSDTNAKKVSDTTGKMSDTNGKVPDTNGKVSDTRPQADKPRRLSYNEKRELEQLPVRIEELEAEEAELGALLSDPEVYRKPATDIAAWQSRLDALPAEIERLMARWAELDERA
jgi:ATP-binding cassette subfamily F protein uup